MSARLILDNIVRTDTNVKKIKSLKLLVLMWWIPLVQAGIQAGGSLLGNSVQNSLSNKAQVQQHRYNRELMQMQYDQNVRLWNMQNSYNSPSAQMARYKEAGLNPNLIYNQQNTASPVQGVTPQKTDVIPKQSGIGSAFDSLAAGMSAFQNLANFRTEQRLQNQQIEMNDIKIATAKLNQNLKQFAVDHQDDYLSFKRMDSDFKKAQTDYVIGKDRRESSLFDYQETIQRAAAKRADYDMTVGYYVKAEMDRVKLEQEYQRLNNMKLSGNLTRKQMRKIDGQMADIASKISHRSDQISLAYARLAEQSRHNLSQEDLARDKFDLMLDTSFDKSMSDFYKTFVPPVRELMFMAGEMFGRHRRERRKFQQSRYNRYGGIR